MKYLKFKIPSEEGKESTKTSALEKILVWLLEKFIPKANPDFDTKYDDVETWFIEYDEENDYANREIGLNKDGHVIVLGPFQNNLGYKESRGQVFDSSCNSIKGTGLIE